jgi:hypothetical protein
MADGRTCVSFGSATTLYVGYKIKRTSTADDGVGCFVDTWYADANCTDDRDFGSGGFYSNKVTGWQDVSTTLTPPSYAHSFLLSCFNPASAPALIDRVYVRASVGGF